MKAQEKMKINQNLKLAKSLSSTLDIEIRNCHSTAMGNGWSKACKYTALFVNAVQIAQGKKEYLENIISEFGLN